MLYICTMKTKNDSKMTVEQIVLQLIMMSGAKNKSRLAEMLGTTPSCLGNWIKRDSLPLSAIASIRNFFPNVNVEWLAQRSDTMLIKSDEPAVQSKPVQTHPVWESNAVPLDPNKCQYSTVQMLDEMVATCGDIGRGDEAEMMTEYTLPIPGLRFLITCRGDSMDPVICSGDMVAVGAPMGMFDRFREGEMYLIVTRESTMVKYIEDPGPDCEYLQLTTANPDYRLADGGRLPKQEVRSIYRVVMVLKWVDGKCR